jgi:hypothetical protein
MGRRRRVVIPDGLVHVVCVVVDGVLHDPVVCVDAMDAAAVTNSVVVAAQNNPSHNVIAGTFKVPVTPSGQEALNA